MSTHLIIDRWTPPPHSLAQLKDLGRMRLVVHETGLFKKVALFSLETNNPSGLITSDCKGDVKLRLTET